MKTSVLILLTSMLYCTQIKAQYNIINSIKTANVLNTGTGPTAPLLNVGWPRPLSCDMYDEGNGKIWAIAWSGASAYSGSTYYGGIKIGYKGAFSSDITIPLLTNYNSPNVVIGYDGTDYIVAVTYEWGGGIYLSTYTITSLSPINYTPRSVIGPLNVLPSFATNPRIDLLADDPVTIQPYVPMHKYALTWEEHTTAGPCGSGYPDYVFLACGDISTAISPATIQVSCDLTRPDVACVHDPVNHIDKIYLTSVLQFNSGYPEIWIYEYDYGTMTRTSLTPIMYGISPASTNEIWSRIDAQTLYNFNTSQEALYVNTYMLDYNTTTTLYQDVSTYTYFPRPSTSGYTTSTYTVAFSGSNLNLNPDVTMPGTFLHGGFQQSPGQDHASVGFATSNQFNEMIFGIDYNTGKLPASNPPYYQDMFGVDYTAGYSGGAPEPADPVVVASSSNTGSDLLVAWFEIESRTPLYGQIYYKFGSVNPTPAFRGSATVTNVNETGTYKVYPTLTTDVVNIDGAEPTDYSVTDIAGREVLQGRAEHYPAQIDVSRLTPGTYIISIAGVSQKTKFSKI